MQINWIIIIAIIILALGLVAYLIWKNQKDQKKVTEYFNSDLPEINDEEEELNNER